MLSLFVFAFWASPAMARVLINELMASNLSSGADEDGDHEDWIELYNSGAEPVDLAGWGLSDNPSQPFKWTFAGGTIGPGEYLLVWASGKNRQAGATTVGLRREVYYNIPGSTIGALIGHEKFPENPDEIGLLTDWFEAPFNVADHYGQRVSGLLVAPETGLYRFWIASDDNGRLSLSPDEFAQNAVPIAHVPGWTSLRQWNKYPQQQSAPIPLVAGQRYFIEALMKEGTGGDNLSVAWQRPDGTFEGPIPAHHFVTAAAANHTNFSVSVEGEAVALTRPDGTTEDFVPATKLRRDVSFGRSAGDPEVWVYFEFGTPGRANEGAEFAGILHDPPVFSAAGGFHAAPFELTLVPTDPEATIYYSLDGSTPDAPGVRTYGYKNRYPRNPGDAPGDLLVGQVETHLYTEPLPIVDRSPLPNRIAQRTTTFDTSANSYAPTGPIFKGTTVRARQVREGFLPGPVATHTYFVGVGTDTRYSLPILALAVDEDDFFDHERGIYNAGIDFETWRASSNGTANGASPANYRRRGTGAQFRASMEIFEPGQGRVAEREVDYRIHGGWSRAWPQKSLRLYARSGHLGGNRIDYPFFSDLLGRGTGAPVESFRRLILRNSGNDYPRTRLRDALIQELVDHYPIDRQAYRPVVHFVNGEYWGLINVRERIDRFFLADHHGVDPAAVAILSNNAAVSEGGAGDRADFLALRQFIATHDMADPAHYATAAAQMDMDNFLLYHAVQIYIGNRDWPHNNIDFWRANAPGVSPATDGRWRWIFFDTDFGLGMYDPPTLNTLEHATNTVNDWAKVKLRRLLANPGFRQRFINAMCDLMAATFHPERVAARADAMAAAIAPYTAEHAARWRDHGSWSVAPIKNYAVGRPAAMQQHLADYFGLGALSTVTLDVTAPDGGHLRFNSLKIGVGLPGLVDMEQPFPWSGQYFNGVPVNVTAVPAPGWRFVGWVGRPELGDSESVEIDPAGGLQLTAAFEPLPVEEPPIALHRWEFEEGVIGPPTFTIGGGGLTIEPGPSTEAVLNEAAQGFATTHLRINSPAGATLRLALPTSNYEGIALAFWARRSGQGSVTHTLSYTLDGETWTEWPADTVSEAPPQHFIYDFAAVNAADDNPLFAVQIAFAQDGSGTAGNNRFDDIVLTGRPIAGANFPPTVVEGALPTGRSIAVTAGTDVAFDIEGWFADPEGDALTYAALSGEGTLAEAQVVGTTLTVTGLAAGETIVVVTADDGANAPVGTTLRLLVYPVPRPVAGMAPYRFDAWSSDAPAMTFPAHMIFLHGTENDSSLSTVLDRAYAIPPEDAANPDDAAWPYAATARTRINGLGEDGVAFINTGRGRDLGGALLALDTRGAPRVQVAFTVGTVLPNARVYAWRLHYRIGREGPWIDVLDEHGAPVEYVRATTAGDAVRLGPVELPAVALDKPEVQLMWRYYRVSGDSGQRAQLRLDDIVVGVELPGYEVWQNAVFSDPADRANPAVSGPAADPLGVGLANLLRYAFGIHDSAQASSRRPLTVVGTDGGPVAVRVPWAPVGDDVAWRIEASTDLEDWSEVIFDSTWPGAAELLVPLEDGWFEAVDPWDGHGGRRFHRVRVWFVETGP